MKTMNRIFALAMALMLLAGSQAFAQKKTEGKIDIDPKLPWSERMALSEIYRFQQGTAPTFGRGQSWSYVEGLVLTSIQEAWKKYPKDIYWDFFSSYGDLLVNEDGSINNYNREEFNIDHVKPGDVLFLLLDKTGEQRYRTALDYVRSQLDDHPRVYSGGFWHKQIYTNQMWLDGLYMGQPFYANYEKRFGDGSNFEDVARQFIIMERQSRDFESGLLYHGWDSAAKMFWADPIDGLSENFWGRAIGWYVMGLVDTLEYFPEDHPRRAELIAILPRICDAMEKVQDPSGVWWQVLDMPNREGNYKEATVTSMMTYSVLKAVRKGYLDPSYLDMAAKSWQGMFKEFITVDADDNEVHLNFCCAVSGLGGKVRPDGTYDQRRDGSFEYYISEPIRANDGKGTGPFIRAALEIETMDEWLPTLLTGKAAMFELK